MDKEEYERNIKLKDIASKQKILDEERYAEDKSTVVLTVDLEPVLLSPALKTSALSYRTKLACHNYTTFTPLMPNVTFGMKVKGGLDDDTSAAWLLDYIYNNERLAVSTICTQMDALS